MREVSRLYRLEPIGVGTPFVESIESYLKRLAEAHSVTVGILLSKEILPCIDINYIKIGHLIHPRGRRINSIDDKQSSGLTQTIVSALERLTRQNGLVYLTFLPLRNHVSRRGLLKETHSWCPLCYEDAVENRMPIYDQLIWSVNGVDVCLKHHSRLQNECPYCRSQQVLLTGTSRNGVCRTCGAWLGAGARRQRDETFNDPNMERDILVAEGVGGIIIHFRDIVNKESCFATNIGKIKEKKGFAIRAFAELIGVAHKEISIWMRGNEKPGLFPLLNIGHVFSVAPHFLLTSEIDADNLSVNVNDMILSNRKTHSNVDYGKILNELNTLLAQDGENSLYACSHILGCHAEYLRKHFPDQVKMIVDKHKMYQNQLREKRYEEIRRVVQELHESGIVPSRKAITRTLGKRIVNSGKGHKVWADKVSSLGYNPLDF